MGRALNCCNAASAADAFTDALTLDQVAAASEHPTPGTDAELARIAVGKAPSASALAARTLAPPLVADDAALRRGDHPSR